MSSGPSSFRARQEDLAGRSEYSDRTTGRPPRNGSRIDKLGRGRICVLTSNPPREPVVQQVGYRQEMWAGLIKFGVALFAA